MLGFSAVEITNNVRVSYRGGAGGFITLMILARGGYPPHQTAEQCFFNGHLVKSFKKVFRRQIPFFSKFVFSNCPPHKFFSGGNPECNIIS